MPITTAGLSCASHRVRTESPNKFFADSRDPTLFSGPLKPSACSLASRCGAGIQRPRIPARMATVQPDRIGAGFRASDKNAVQAYLV